LRQEKYRVVIVDLDGIGGTVQLIQKYLAFEKIGQRQDQGQKDADEQQSFDRAEGQPQHPVGKSDDPAPLPLAEKQGDQEKDQLDDQDDAQQRQDRNDDIDQVFHRVALDDAHRIGKIIRQDLRDPAQQAFLPGAAALGQAFIQNNAKTFLQVCVAAQKSSYRRRPHKP